MQPPLGGLPALRMNLWPVGWRRAPRDGMDTAAEQRQVVEAVLRSATALVAADDDPQQLIARHCEALTMLAPRIVLAWTWFGPPRPDQIRPQVVAGSASSYARNLVIENNFLTQQGPAHRSLAGRRLDPFNVSRHSLYGPWRRAAQEYGVRSVLALPLRSSVDDQRGLFVLYSDRQAYFDRVGVGLFDALAGLFSAVLSRAARNAALARVAHRDALTGLANRHALALLDLSARRLSPLDPASCVMLLDIDHFKRINDSAGHAAGDAALCQVAKVLQASLRQGDTVARWGGEEFVVWLPALTLDAARTVADKLRAAVAASSPTPLTVSIGVVELAFGESLSDAVGRADAAMYRAKQQGRNRVVVDADTAPAA